MTATRIPAIALAMGLNTLPTLAFAQASGNSDVAAAAPAATGVNATGQVSDSGWTGANEPAPAPVTPAPSTTTATLTPPPPATTTTPPATSEFQSKPSAATAEETRSSDEPMTLFGGRRVKFGGYGQIGVRYTRLRGEDSAIAGFEGAFLIDHRLAVGFAGYGSSQEHRLASVQGFDRPYMHFGYGGFLVRYHVFIPESPVSFSLATLIGGGAVGVTNEWNDEVHRNNADMFFIVEPQLGAHLNVTRWMRFGLDAGYRFVSGIGKFGLSESDFRGASVGGSVGFGWF